jgi:Tfp pilus assembly protein PilF
VLNKNNSVIPLFVLCSLFFVLLFSACATTGSPKDPGKAEAFAKLGYAYIKNGQLNEAFIQFQKSIELNPSNKQALYYLGFISTKFNNHDEAISYYNRAISADPKYSDAKNALGVAYAELGKWDEAIIQFKDALTNPVYRTPAQAYSNMGYAYYMKSEYSQAEESLKEAIMRNPTSHLSIYWLGLVYLKFDENEAAVKEFERAIGIMPDNFGAHWELANAYLRSGENDKAITHFKVVAERDVNIERSREALEYIELLQR